MTPNWYLPLTVMTFILGAFIGLALKAENKARKENLPSTRFPVLASYYASDQNRMLGMEDTIGELNRQIAILSDSASSRASKSHALDEELNQARVMAGLTEVEGPGIVITLKDSPKRPPSDVPPELLADISVNYLIHDVDIQRVVNELSAAGAEAFAINGQRVVANTAVRCVGPAIQVNGVPLTPPYKIAAIGDPKGLSTALNMQNGVADMLRQTDPAMIAVDQKDKMVLPAFDGVMQFRFAKPVSDTTEHGLAVSAGLRQHLPRMGM